MHCWRAACRPVLGGNIPGIGLVICPRLSYTQDTGLSSPFTKDGPNSRWTEQGSLLSSWGSTEDPAGIWTWMDREEGNQTKPWSLPEFGKRALWCQMPAWHQGAGLLGLDYKKFSIPHAKEEDQPGVHCTVKVTHFQGPRFPIGMPRGFYYDIRDPGACLGPRLCRLHFHKPFSGVGPLTWGLLFAILSLPHPVARLGDDE